MSKNVATFDIGMDYNTLSKTKAKEYKSLSAKKHRDALGLFLVEGGKSIADTLSTFETECLICSREWADSHPGICTSMWEKVFVADKKTMGMVSSFDSVPEVIAVYKKPESFDEVPVVEKGRLYLLLDEIQDPGNLGTIIRTCDWFGVYEIFASPSTVDVYGHKVVQATMGSLARVKVRYLELERLIDKNPELRVIGTVLNGESIDTVNISPEGFLLMGNEGRGISESLMKKIDCGVTIPPANPESHPDSLNVSVATAIILSRLTMKK